MSLNKEAYIRYKIIDGCIRNLQKPYPSMDDLIATCKNKLGKTFNVSTIQKDIKTMKEDEELGFMAPIKFSKSNTGYYYSNPDFSISQIPLQENEIEALKTASDMLQVISGSRVGQSFDSALKKIMISLREKTDKNRDGLPIVSLEKAPQQTGLEHFEFLINVIKTKTAISFVHFHFLLCEFSTDIMHPYQLFEFNNNWYLIGFSENRKGIRVCGLDKIFDPIELKVPFNNSKFQEVKKYNEDMYGVKPIEGQKKQKISFVTAPDTANYLNAQPLHHSQKATWHQSRGCVAFTINVIPTYDLIRYFFMNSNRIKVFNNEFVIEQIKELVDDILSDYKN